MLTNYDIDRILGGTPCVCGDFTTWHQRCYVGKCSDEIYALYRKAYRKARAALKRRAEIAVDDALERFKP